MNTKTVTTANKEEHTIDKWPTIDGKWRTLDECVTDFGICCFLQNEDNIYVFVVILNGDEVGRGDYYKAESLYFDTIEDNTKPLTYRWICEAYGNVGCAGENPVIDERKVDGEMSGFKVAWDATSAACNTNNTWPVWLLAVVIRMCGYSLTYNVRTNAYKFQDRY